MAEAYAGRMSNATAASWVAVLVFVLRGFVDWRYVNGEFLPDVTSTAAAIGGYAVVLAAWAWAVLRLDGGGRRARWVALGCTVAFGLGMAVGTTVAFCPTPCGTAWPLMEAFNWAQFATSLVAATLLVRAGPVGSTPIVPR